MNLDTALGNSLGPDDTMLPGGNTGHLYLYGLCYGVTSSLQPRVGSVKDPEPLFLGPSVFVNHRLLYRVQIQLGYRPR